MPLKNYGVLKGKAIESKIGEGPSPHYQVLIDDSNTKHRIAINVKSKLSPSELLYSVDENFEHPIISGIVGLDYGFTELERKPGTEALDYVRGNLLDTEKMKPLPHDVPGPDNDLNELIELYIARAITSDDASVYAFGEKWGPEESKKDKYFGFLPGNGIHDIHMNQGNGDKFKKDNGVWQDGGLLIHYPSRQQWVGIFLAFQSQSFHTDDTTGHRINDGKQVLPEQENEVSIVAAMVNPYGADEGKETVTLINSSARNINLDGWMLADRYKRKQPLSGIIAAGEVMKVTLAKNGISLGNKGGIITLLNTEGLKVDGVSYTKENAQKQGWTVLF
ncbi:MAG: DUF2278 family protein [Cyanobacteria bacterium P01_A01_bin.45]